MVNQEGMNSQKKEYKKNLEAIKESLKEKEKELEEIKLKVQSLNQQLANFHNSKIRRIINPKGKERINQKIADCLIKINELNNEISEEIKSKEVITSRNYQVIHPNFTSKLQKEWESRGFSYDNCKEWINAGLKVEDAGYAWWLQFVKNKNVQWVLNNDDDKQLRQDFADSLLSKEVISQIKKFEHDKLTHEQKMLVEKLIPSETLRKKYIESGLCLECNQPYSSRSWCQDCNAKHFQEDFKKWSSGNLIVDECIKKHQLSAIHSEKILEWIPYNKFTDIEYLDKGGFGKVYEANWVDGAIDCWDNKKNKWKRKEWTKKIVLKNLNDSQNINRDFLKEVTYVKLVESGSVVNCYGLSQDPATKNYVMVMQYIGGGNLRQFLKSSYNRSELETKLRQLNMALWGLKEIHKQGLVHRDLHPGNILSIDIYSYISDLGLCQPASETNNKKIYGVLPYVAPEVLCGGSYTQAADIYSWSMIMYEMFSGFPPYCDIAHDEYLARRVCQGYRPDLEEIKVPQLLKDLIKRCWEADIERRPSVEELAKILENWYHETFLRSKSSEFYKQFLQVDKEEVEKYKKVLSKFFSKESKKEYSLEIRKELYSEFCEENGYKGLEWMVDVEHAFNYFLLSELGNKPLKTIHSHAVYTSRLLDFKNLLEPQKSQKISKQMEFNIDELDNYLKENEKETSNDQSNWQNIHLNFTSQLISSWTNLNFTPLQVREWLNTGLTPQDYNFASWLRDTKNLTPEQTLNHHNLEQLRQEFFTYWQEQQQAQIEQPPK